VCVCAGATALYKALSSDGLPLSAALPAQSFLANLNLQTLYRHLAVVVDVSCAEGLIFVAQESYCLRAAINVIDSSVCVCVMCV